MLRVTDFPTDKYNRYPALIKELIKATAIADRSEDNKEQLLSIIGIITQKYKKKVVPKNTKKTTT